MLMAMSCMHLGMSCDFTALFVAVIQMSVCCLGIALSDVSRNLSVWPLKVGGNAGVGYFRTSIFSVSELRITYSSEYQPQA